MAGYDAGEETGAAEPGARGAEAASASRSGHSLAASGHEKAPADAGGEGADRAVRRTPGDLKRGEQS